MRQKRINFVLVMGVLVIWVFVVKRSFIVWGKESNVAPSSLETKQMESIPEYRKDTFQLTNLERDPFLEYIRGKRGLTPVVNLNKTKKKTSRPSKRQEQPNIIWSKLKYFGYLKGDSKTEKLALLKIDSKLHRIREKKSMEDIHVIKVYKDSVVLRKNGVNKVIIK